MNATTHHSSDIRRAAHIPQSFLPLVLEQRPTIATEAAAFYLNRRPQTLRGWACSENGPIRPIRINGRLAWRTNEIKTLLEIA